MKTNIDMKKIKIQSTKQEQQALFELLNIFYAKRQELEAKDITYVMVFHFIKGLIKKLMTRLSDNEREPLTKKMKTSYFPAEAVALLRMVRYLDIEGFPFGSYYINMLNSYNLKLDQALA